MSGDYCGDSPGKRVARTLMYIGVLETTRVQKRHGGYWVTLAGDFGEREVLSRLSSSGDLKPADLVLVDRDAIALRRASALWPAAECESDLADALRARRGLCRFINLDLMGPPTRSMIDLLIEGFRALAPYGVLAVTFMRGRDGAFTRSILRRLRWSPTMLDTARQMAFQLTAQRLLISPGNRSIYYHSGKSPMQTALFVRTPALCEGVEGLQRLADFNYRHWLTIGKEAPDIVPAREPRLLPFLAERRFIANAMPSKKLRAIFCSAIVDASGVSNATVAAALAHLSRGTYGASVNGVSPSRNRQVPEWTQSKRVATSARGNRLAQWLVPKNVRDEYILDLYRLSELDALRSARATDRDAMRAAR